ncbi:MAG: FAD-dependent oxidoreductase, partial [Armatimonadetes bacterium]|nr:FAD-dependent oxidoreductase [Armatimonadota bacterium]
WPYRQILRPEHFQEGFAPSLTLVNWPQIDYWLGPIVDVSPEEAQKHLEGARQLSFSFIYWMQTEAPRHDGGEGYPEIRLRPDVTGTLDGMAKYPYIRESRRILAEFTVAEQHVSSDLRPDGAQKFEDSVGVGCYRIDLHPTTALKNYLDVGSQPFQIPLGALIPQRVENLLPACKNLGVTHITNGCYRLHPVEWNIGEAAGVLAAFCLDEKLAPRAVRNSPEKLREFQKRLESDGVELDWPQLHAV